MGRLSALARTHAMLADASWEGAPLREIIVRELSGLLSSISVTGCEIMVTTLAAQAFALIIHELGTNAVKYGALSSPDGRITIEGNVVQLNGKRYFSFRWRESGGPPVSQPVRNGFGSAILIDAAKQQFGNNDDRLKGRGKIVHFGVRSPFLRSRIVIGFLAASATRPRLILMAGV